ncbi:hypothetical protein B0H12DRAFT_1242279 [Mycena haematopus]|nr:hypothetical protein B0H12DRAFT_1242279 [Mycena haematopus]
MPSLPKCKRYSSIGSHLSYTLLFASLPAWGVRRGSIQDDYIPSTRTEMLTLSTFITTLVDRHRRDGKCRSTSTTIFAAFAPGHRRRLRRRCHVAGGGVAEQVFCVVQRCFRFDVGATTSTSASPARSTVRCKRTGARGPVRSLVLLSLPRQRLKASMLEPANADPQAQWSTGATGIATRGVTSTAFASTPAQCCYDPA